MTLCLLHNVSDLLTTLELNELPTHAQKSLILSRRL